MWGLVGIPPGFASVHLWWHHRQTWIAPSSSELLLLWWCSAMGKTTSAWKLLRAPEDPPGRNLSSLTNNHQDKCILTVGGNAFKNPQTHHCGWIFGNKSYAYPCSYSAFSWKISVWKPQNISVTPASLPTCSHYITGLWFCSSVCYSSFHPACFQLVLVRKISSSFNDISAAH